MKHLKTYTQYNSDGLVVAIGTYLAVEPTIKKLIS